MGPRELFINPAGYGLPTRDELVSYRIWDTHFHGFNTAQNPVAQFNANNFYVEPMGIERSGALDVGGTLAQPLVPSPYDDKIRNNLETQQDRASDLPPIEPGFPDESCAKMEQWIRSGPCIGIKYVGGNKSGTGAQRILSAHERSFTTELANVLGAQLSDDDRRLILGENLRRLLALMLRRKGRAIE